MTGYSDRINHALAFAAKHHDRQVRKGTALPYLTHPANVAIILTRYGRDDETVIAGILHDVIEDCVRGGWTPEMLEERIGEKFGATVLETVLAVTYRRVDEDGNELDKDEQRADYLQRLERASDGARWVCAADKVHNGSSDPRRPAPYARSGYGVGPFFSRTRGNDPLVSCGVRTTHDVGFDAPILAELREVAEALEHYST